MTIEKREPIQEPALTPEEFAFNLFMAKMPITSRSQVEQTARRILETDAPPDLLNHLNQAIIEGHISQAEFNLDIKNFSHQVTESITRLQQSLPDSRIPHIIYKPGDSSQWITDQVKPELFSRVSAYYYTLVNPHQVPRQFLQNIPQAELRNFIHPETPNHLINEYDLITRLAAHSPAIVHLDEWAISAGGILEFSDGIKNTPTPAGANINLSLYLMYSSPYAKQVIENSPAVDDTVIMNPHRIQMISEVLLPDEVQWIVTQQKQHLGDQGQTEDWMSLASGFWKIPDNIPRLFTDDTSPFQIFQRKAFHTPY